MNNKQENLEGIVSKLKEQGINAGEEEKKRLLEAAKTEVDALIAEAKAESKAIIDQAKFQAEQAENNAQKAMVQASRDLLEATKIAVLNHLKTVFGEQCERLFSQEQYLKEITKAALESISGQKILSVSPEVIKGMEDFLVKEAFAKEVSLKPLLESEAKIVVNSTEKDGLQFVLSAEDVQDGLFSLMHKDLVQSITKKQEA